MRVLASVLLPLLLVALVGCQSFTDPLGRQDALEDFQKRYTNFVRWGDLERASRFVKPEARAAFLSRLPALENIRVTGVDVQEIDYTGEDEVEVIVTYHGFSLQDMVERRFRERQQWSREPGIQGRWWVTSDLVQALGTLARGA